MITLKDSEYIQYESLGELLRSNETWEGKFIWINKKMISTTIVVFVIALLIGGILGFVSGVSSTITSLASHAIVEGEALQR